jgi:nitrite reductase/ring-hydroxylating ferredoxin subunit
MVTVRLGRVEDFSDGALVPVEVDGGSYLVARDGDGVCVVRNKCPHLGLSLSKGPGGIHYDGGVVQCPWHNSRFTVCGGENLDWATGFAGINGPSWSRRIVGMGRAPSPLTTFETRVEDGFVVIDA